MNLAQALEIVIMWLDGKMQEAPNRKLADISNFLQDEYNSEMAKKVIAEQNMLELDHDNN